MLIDLWNNLLYEPFVNVLALLISIIPGGDLGIAVILLTIIVRLVLFPLYKKQIKSQAELAKLTPELNKIKNSGKSKEEQARLTFDLYKEHKVNPFSGCLVLIIQIPIILALYSVFYKELDFSGTLYSFIQAPEFLNTQFLGLVDIASKSLVLAIIAGVTQYLQAHFMPAPVLSSSDGKSFADTLSKNMRVQMKYVFPFIVVFIAYNISGAIALYWATSNLFSVGQQLLVTKHSKNNPAN